MRSRSIFQAIALVSLLGAGPVACVEVGDEVMLPASPSVPPAAPAPGLTTGCGEAGPTIGRLRGHVYVVPIETRRLPDFAALPSSGTICLDRLAVTERRGFPGFPGVRGRTQWFGVDLDGAFTVTEPGVFHFRLTSDDGAKLIVDGVPVIDADGAHAVHVAQGSVALGAGVHIIAVPFWQGPGPLALVLEVARPGEGWEIFRVDRPL